MSIVSARWALYRWDLRGVDFTLSLPPGYNERSATTADAIRILDVVLLAYGSDPAWREQLPVIATRMHHRIRQTLAHPSAAYLLVDSGNELAAVSGIAVSHWTNQNFLTGVCVHPRHQRGGLGTFLLGRSLQWLQSQGVLEPQVYTEFESLADRKIYRLYGSTRFLDVPYPGRELPPQSDSYAVVHNRYFDGRVESLGFGTPHGYVTTGVITPGQYQFTADYEEHVLILAGTLDVKLPGRDWVEVPTNDAYVVPAGAAFEVKSETDVAYLCRFRPV